MEVWDFSFYRSMGWVNLEVNLKSKRIVSHYSLFYNCAPVVKIFYVRLRYTSLTSENDVSSWLGICSSFYFKINLCKGQTDQSDVFFFPIKFLFRLNERSLSSQSKYWAKIPSVHYVLKLVAILLCFFCVWVNPFDICECKKFRLVFSFIWKYDIAQCAE